MKNETIEDFKENETLNIEEIINRYNAYIYKILRNSITNEQDIEEILSDVFLIFWKNYKRLDINMEVKPYLIGITKNLIKKKYNQYNVNFQNIELNEDEILYNIDFEELVENNEKSKIIQKCLYNMKVVEREVFTMFYFRQGKIKEISKSLNISESKVKIILYRARKSIKKSLKERGYSYGK